LGVKTFIDKVEIQWGDSIVGKINSALQKSKFVVAIISESSIGKAWPLKELHAVLGMEIGSGDTKLLPLIVGNEEELLMQLPLIKDKAYLPYT
ncbi:toll/interleukin-1 receptor domain-containing protein, partial [Escherichia coli]|nr:toll/interleukin-1 receptor domain-containing protein [Escherichia coli]